MFEVAWGLALQGGAILSASGPGAAICPCCRHPLARSPGGDRFHHADDTPCSAAGILHALALRVALAALGAGVAPPIREQCVCCGEGTADRVDLGGGSPGGGAVVWSRPGAVVRLGQPDVHGPAALGALWLAPQDILAGQWHAMPRRKCASCAASEADWMAAHRAWLQAHRPPVQVCAAS
jgi:hypothetical protein